MFTFTFVFFEGCLGIVVVGEGGSERRKGREIRKRREMRERRGAGRGGRDIEKEWERYTEWEREWEREREAWEWEREIERNGEGWERKREINITERSRRRRKSRSRSRHRHRHRGSGGRKERWEEGFGVEGRRGERDTIQGRMKNIINET